MIIIRFLGGLGNQLFIYAFGRALELNYNIDVYFDTYSGFKNDPFKRKFELDNFNTKLKKTSFFNSLFYPLKKRSTLILNFFHTGSVYIEEDNNFTIALMKEQIEKHKKVFLQGYFQNQEYFEGIKEEIKNEISLKYKLNDPAKNYLEEINNNNSVAVHLRRKERKELIPLEFYLQNIKTLESKLDSPKFFIFSDQIEWCKNNISKNDNIVFVTGTSNQIEDFWLMKNCNHFIIGNSTFSWWANWLSDNNRKITISPLS